MHTPLLVRTALIGFALGCSSSNVATAVRPESPNAIHVAPSTPAYWPTSAWREATPESQGVSSRLLSDVMDSIRARSVSIHSLLIIRHGYVVLDAAFYPFAPDERHDIASVTKSVTSVLTGISARDGGLDRGQRILSVLARDTSGYDVRERGITIGNLLDMQSGFNCGFQHSEAELSSMQSAASWIKFALDLPMRSTPGTELGYCSPNYHLLSAALTKAVGVSESTFARRALFAPLGIEDVYWPSDPSGLSHGWGDLQLRPRDLAKIGFLYLHGGRWEDRQLVDSSWVVRSGTPRIPYGDRNFYGNGWWTHPDSPPGFYEAIGRGGQRLSIWPEKDLVFVAFGGGFEPGDFGPALARAVTSDSALPPDPSGYDRLRSRVAMAREAPDAQPVSVSAFARRITGRRYDMMQNALGLQSLMLEFDEQAATAHLELADRRLRLAVGLDGRFKISADTVAGIHPGARGAWGAQQEFVMEMNLIGKINRYTFRLDFDGDSVRGQIDDPTTGQSIRVRGTARR